jgi:hypothetical protein
VGTDRCGAGRQECSTLEACWSLCGDADDPLGKLAPYVIRGCQPCFDGDSAAMRSTSSLCATRAACSRSTCEMPRSASVCVLVSDERTMVAPWPPGLPRAPLALSISPSNCPARRSARRRISQALLSASSASLPAAGQARCASGGVAKFVDDRCAHAMSLPFRRKGQYNRRSSRCPSCRPLLR